MDTTTQRLQEMLDAREDSEIIAGETGIRATGTTRRADTGEAVNVEEVISEGGTARPAADINLLGLQLTGRGPTGRLRNFRAMGQAKLEATYRTCMREGNDPEALEAIRAEMQNRG